MTNSNQALPGFVPDLKKLTKALKEDDIPAVQDMIKNGLDVNAEIDQIGNRAFHYVKSVEMAKVLHNAGADPNGRNANGETPIFSDVIN